MSPLEATPTKLGLRERKKQQTRETIARAALELFAERGYDQTTLAEIAEAADVSPRTIFGYFESKEDILFCEEHSYHDRLKQELEQRPPGATTVDALRKFVGSLPPPDEESVLRKKVVAANPGLLMKLRARHGQFESVLIDSIARDLGAGPDDIRPPLIAASITAAFTTARDRFEEATGEPLTHEQAMQVLDEVLEFLRGGLEALQRG